VNHRHTGIMTEGLLSPSSRTLFFSRLVYVCVEMAAASFSYVIVPVKGESESY
jgi:hypothetical protein